ncbi:hypothetical protein [Stenotrophomonas sp. G4]|uniref:hypothetical protein n=1 Tax=Stenotrophomonas sp. G4 TaxID=2303750 RepID=UPI0013C30327|nr:hypothetical protein [Stenotrophomonas sp. G4]
MNSVRDEATEDKGTHCKTCASRRTQIDYPLNRGARESWQGSIALLMIIVTAWAAYEAISSGAIDEDRDTLTSIQLSIAVGSLCSFVPGFLFGALFDAGTHPFRAFFRWVKFETPIFYFCLALILLIAGGIAIWVTQNYLTIPFTPTELVISLVAGSITGSTVVPVLISHLPRRG